MAISYIFTLGHDSQGISICYLRNQNYPIQRHPKIKTVLRSTTAEMKTEDDSV